MPEFPETSESLIAQVRDPSNRAAWNEFEQLYRPVVFRIARARGLQHTDALDLVQQVLLSVATAIGRYKQRSDGPGFRNWLNRITRNAILKALTRGPLDKAAGGSQILDVLAEVPSVHPEMSALIDLEYRRELFQKAAAQVRSEVLEITWLAFEQTVLNQSTVAQTAETLGVPTGSVYAARSRVMRRLRDTVRQLEDSDSEDNNHATD